MSARRLGIHRETVSRSVRQGPEPTSKPGWPGAIRRGTSSTTAFRFPALDITQEMATAMSPLPAA